MTRWRRSKSLCFLLLLVFIGGAAQFAYCDIAGIVMDADGKPIFNATIRVYDGVREIAVNHTDKEGLFFVPLEPGNYTGLVYSTTNYLPSSFPLHETTETLNVTLQHGSLIEFTGDQQYIDTESLPLQTTMLVLDENGDQLYTSGYELVFGTEVPVPGRVPILSHNQVLVPVGQYVQVLINSSYLFESQIQSRHVIVPINPVPIGTQRTIDLREYSLISNLDLANESFIRLEHRLDELRGYGFYLERQESSLSNGLDLFRSASRLYFEEEYGDSFEQLKKGYLVFEQATRELDLMYNDARVSIYIIIGFLSVSSLVLGYLITDDSVSQLIADAAIYALGLSFFYLTYPGSRIISIQLYLVNSVGIFALNIGLRKLVPTLFKKTSSDGRVHTRNLILPIFNIAKRSLRRRKLRFVLTLISLTLLVTSFVTLTSFSQGYGVTSSWRQSKTTWEGVIIRDGGWQPSEQTFLTYDDIEINWILTQPEVETIYSKAEGIPLKHSIMDVAEHPIFGIIGGTQSEYEQVNLKAYLVDGELPTDGVLISENLAGSTGYIVGDNLTLGSLNLKINGIFSDSVTQLRDLDGTPYLSQKWENTNPRDESPIWVLSEVAPIEQVFTSLNVATKIPLIGVQRIGITVNPAYSLESFAERLTLERGYKSYSSTQDGFTAFSLGNYFEGKGLSLVIPWVIVVLNVVVTMLNSLFERKKEIEILSAVGLNPAQVSAVFVAEAVITGFIAGGLGYLTGLGLYKALALLNIGLQVHQKVSAIWSIASIALAISAVLTGALAALRNSVVITPSLMRRWKVNDDAGGFSEPWTVNIPVKLDSQEIGVYLDYIESQLNNLKDHPVNMTSSIKRLDSTTLSFVYKAAHSTTGNFYTKNELRIEPSEEYFTAVLSSVGERTWVHVIGSEIRKMTMDYTTEKNG